MHKDKDRKGCGQIMMQSTLCIAYSIFNAIAKALLKEEGAIVRTVSL